MACECSALAAKASPPACTPVRPPSWAFSKEPRLVRECRAGSGGRGLAGPYLAAVAQLRAPVCRRAAGGGHRAGAAANAADLASHPASKTAAAVSVLAVLGAVLLAQRGRCSPQLVAAALVVAVAPTRAANPRKPTNRDGDAWSLGLAVWRAGGPSTAPALARLSGSVGSCGPTGVAARPRARSSSGQAEDHVRQRSSTIREPVGSCGRTLNRGRSSVGFAWTSRITTVRSRCSGRAAWRRC